MISRLPTPWIARIAAAAATAAICALPAFAQTAPSQTAAAAPGPAGEQPEVPRDAVINALTGSREGLAALNQFLTGGASPEEVTRRATQLIQSLSQQRGAVEPEGLLRAIDRVTALASRKIARSEIIQLAVQAGYRPGQRTLALDFGPPDGSVHQGFERVVPGDPRVKGKTVNGLRRPAESELLSDGISGVEKVEVPVRNGRYRVLLMTQNLGDQQLSTLPFGAQIRVNGVPILIGGSQPSEWRREAMLTNEGASLAGSGGRRLGGFITADVGNRARDLFVRQQGGALVIEALSDQDKIVIEFVGFNESESYLTGMMIEPWEETSDLLLTPEAQGTLVPLDLRMALESQIIAAAASVIEQIAPPEAGRPDLRDLQLPEPQFETTDVVSES